MTNRNRARGSTEPRVSDVIDGTPSPDVRHIRHVSELRCEDSITTLPAPPEADAEYSAEELALVSPTIPKQTDVRNLTTSLSRELGLGRVSSGRRIAPKPRAEVEPLPRDAAITEDEVAEESHVRPRVTVRKKPKRRAS